MLGSEVLQIRAAAGHKAAVPEDVLEGGEGGSERVGGWRVGPFSQGPPVVPAEGGPNILKLKSSWHRRLRSKILAVSLKHWKGRRGGGPGGVPSSSCGARPL